MFTAPRIVVTFEAHRDEVIRDDAQRTARTLVWPADVPLPGVGDEVPFGGNYVTIVEREGGPDIDDVESERHGEGQIHYTLRWLDRRLYAGSPFTWKNEASR